MPCAQRNQASRQDGEGGFVPTRLRVALFDADPDDASGFPSSVMSDCLDVAL
jgi:hypothetical protein